MDDGSQWTWLIVILLLFAAVFFAITETAFASVSRVRLKTDAERGDKRAERALYVTEHFDRAITTLLICTNIVHIATASIVTVYVTKRWGVSAVSISTLVTTLVVFFFGEMLPKSIARKYSEPLSLATAGILSFLMMILKPAAALLTLIGNLAAKATKGDDETSVTENDIYDIIEDMTEEGTINEEQSELISSALQFGDVTVESILTSRMDVAAIDINMPQEEILQFIKEQNHSRLPVYEGSIDNITGILYHKDFFNIAFRSKTNISEIVKPAIFVPKSKKISDLRKELQEQQLHIAVVMDEFGCTVGLVTLEDILEELVGEIWDEHDEIVREISKVGENTFIVSGKTNVEKLFEVLKVDSEFEAMTVSGWVMEVLEKIPSQDDTFESDGLKVRVMKMSGKRIEQVEIVRLTEKDEEEA